MNPQAMKVNNDSFIYIDIENFFFFFKYKYSKVNNNEIQKITIV